MTPFAKFLALLLAPAAALGLFAIASFIAAGIWPLWACAPIAAGWAWVCGVWARGRQ